MAGSLPPESVPAAGPLAPESAAVVWTPPAAVPEVPVVPLPSESPPAVAPLPAPMAVGPQGWEAGLQAEAQALLESGRTDVWDVLTHRFETCLIQTALASTRGRRIEAAQKLGIGRNTITRKIQELNLE